MSSYVIGIDIGGTMIKGALLNKEGELIEKHETASHPEKDTDAFIANIISFVNHIHLGLQITISKLCFNSAYYWHLRTQILWANPIKSKVGKRGLTAPPGGHIKIVNKLLDMLVYVIVLHFVNTHKWCEIGVK